MNEIEAVTYEESREAFFASALRKAERQLDWAVKHNPDCYVCAEKGEAVAYYQDALAALREKAERERGCAWICTDDDKGLWQCSACGVEWVLEAGTPRENEMNFCLSCGRDLGKRLEVEHGN